MLKTVQGDQLKAKIVGGEILINGVKVVAKDVLTKNRVVHVVNGVLVPEA